MMMMMDNDNDERESDWICGAAGQCKGRLRRNKQRKDTELL